MASLGKKCFALFGLFYFSVSALTSTNVSLLAYEFVLIMGGEFTWVAHGGVKQLHARGQAEPVHSVRGWVFQIRHHAPFVLGEEDRVMLHSQKKRPPYGSSSRSSLSFPACRARVQGSGGAEEVVRWEGGVCGAGLKLPPNHPNKPHTHPPVRPPESSSAPPGVRGPEEKPRRWGASAETKAALGQINRADKENSTVRAHFHMN